MNTEYFGDVILYKNRDWDSRLVSLFTGSEFTHSAMRISENHASSISWRGKREHDLEDGEIPYEIYTHRNLSPELRRQMFEMNTLITEEYSLKTIFKLAGRIITLRGQDSKELKSEGLTCSGRIGLLYNCIGLDVLEGVHYTQLTPRDFSLSPQFEVQR